MSLSCTINNKTNMAAEFSACYTTFVISLTTTFHYKSLCSLMTFWTEVFWLQTRHTRWNCRPNRALQLIGSGISEFWHPQNFHFHLTHAVWHCEQVNTHRHRQTHTQIDRQTDRDRQTSSARISKVVPLSRAGVPVKHLSITSLCSPTASNIWAPYTYRPHTQWSTHHYVNSEWVSEIFMLSCPAVNVTMMLLCFSFVIYNIMHCPADNTCPPVTHVTDNRTQPQFCPVSQSLSHCG